MLPIALSIAGSDPTCGAGAGADVLTFNSLKTYGLQVLTALTAQTVGRVTGIQSVNDEMFSEQMETVFSNFNINSAKTGLISTPHQVKLIAEYTEKYCVPLVVDPVINASDGTVFTETETVKQLVKELYPKAMILTPNIPEAELITGCKIKDLNDLVEASDLLLKLNIPAVLIKGGHLDSGSEVFDLLNIKGEMKIFKKSRAPVGKVHGTGCVLSAAITAYIANRCSLSEAVMRAEEYFSEVIQYPLLLGGDSKVLQPNKLLVDAAERLDVLNELNYANKTLISISKILSPYLDEESSLAFSISRQSRLKDVAALSLKRKFSKENGVVSDCPMFGLDDLASKVILGVKKYFPHIRAAFNIYAEKEVDKYLRQNSDLQFIEFQSKYYQAKNLELVDELNTYFKTRKTGHIADAIIINAEGSPKRIIILGVNTFEILYKFLNILKKIKK